MAYIGIENSPLDGADQADRPKMHRIYYDLTVIRMLLVVPRSRRLQTALLFTSFVAADPGIFR